MSVAVLEGTGRHFARSGFAHCAVFRKGGGRNAKYFLLGLVGVGNEATLVPLRAAGDGGNDGADPAAGARFGA